MIFLFSIYSKIYKKKVNYRAALSIFKLIIIFLIFNFIMFRNFSIFIIIALKMFY